MSDSTAFLASKGVVGDVRVVERTITLPLNFPKIVTLCGSTRFEKEYIQANRMLTLGGCIVISVGLFGHQEGLDMAGETKQALDLLHLRKVDLADVVVIVNPGGYIGDSTRREIDYAKSTGKPVVYLYGEGV